VIGSVHVWIDGGQHHVAEGSNVWRWSFRPSDIGPGVHTLNVQAFDLAGNPSEIESTTFVISSAGVVPVTITSPSPDTSLVPGSTFSIVGTASPGPGGASVAKVEVTDPNGSVMLATGTSTWSRQLVRAAWHAFLEGTGKPSTRLERQRLATTD
jgi:hypothetical protein